MRYPDPLDRPVVYPILRASPRFRRFWLARLLSHTAQNALLLGLLVTVVNQTGSTIHSSLLVLTFIIPSALLGVAGGVVTDRLPLSELLVTTGFLRTALCLFFLRTDSGVTAIYGTNLVLSVLTQFASPAEAAALPLIVQESQVVTATAALNLEFILAQVLGTVLLAPLFIRSLGLRPLFVLAALGFFAAALLYTQIRGLDRSATVAHRHPPEIAGPGALRDAALQIWRLLKTDSALMQSTVTQTLVATTVIVLVSIVPIYTRYVLHLPAENSVAVFAPAAIGMFLSLRIVPWLARRFSKDRLVSIGFGLFVVGVGLLGFDREISLLLALDPAFSRPAIAAVISGPTGFAYGVVLVTARAIQYERVPMAMQGRVFAFQSVLGNIASILPLILVGAVAYWLGPRIVLVLVAAANLAAAWYARRLVIGEAAGQPPSPGDEESPGPQPAGG